MKKGKETAALLHIYHTIKNYQEKIKPFLEPFSKKILTKRNKILESLDDVEMQKLYTGKSLLDLYEKGHMKLNLGKEEISINKNGKLKVTRKLSGGEKNYALDILIYLLKAGRGDSNEDIAFFLEENEIIAEYGLDLVKKRLQRIKPDEIIQQYAFFVSYCSTPALPFPPLSHLFKWSDKTVSALHRYAAIHGIEFKGNSLKKKTL